MITCAAEAEDDGKERGIEEEVEVLVVLVLGCVLISVLGNAVHLFPPSVVIKAPRGRFGLVDMMVFGWSRANPVANPPSFLYMFFYINIWLTVQQEQTRPPLKGVKEKKGKPRPLGPSSASQIHPVEIGGRRGWWMNDTWSGRLRSEIRQRTGVVVNDEDIRDGFVGWLDGWPARGRRARKKLRWWVSEREV